jgi:pyruvyltransferase
MGDVLTRYAIEQSTGEKVQFVSDFKSPHLFVSGSILREATDNAIVVGSGFNGNNQKLNGDPKIYSVRGPLTLKQLPHRYGDLPTGDPALMLPLLYKPEVEVEYDLGIVPHYIDSDSRVITEYVNKSNFKVNVINILADVEEVVDEINKCLFIISSTLHGLITAHAYGVPGIWVEFSDKVAGGGYKFLDYFRSMGVSGELKPVNCRNEIPDNITSVDRVVVTWDHSRASKLIDLLKIAVEDVKPS